MTGAQAPRGRARPRIVSLLPSATEIVFALGLGDQLVGVSHECDWPPEARSKPSVRRPTRALAGRSHRTIHQSVTRALHGGSSLYALDEAALSAAEPDLILTQELCEVCAVGYGEVSEVARRLDAEATVVSLEPTSIEGIFNTIMTVGAMTATENRAVKLVGRLRRRLLELERKVERRRDEGFVGPRIVALEWIDPPFATGHWVPEQVRRAGGWDLLGREGERSVETTWRAVREVDPEMIVLMPCGVPIRDAVAEYERVRTRLPQYWKRVSAVRRGQVFAVDGNAYYSRPGPRVVEGIAMLCEIFDPDTFVDTSPAGAWTPIL